MRFIRKCRHGNRQLDRAHESPPQSPEEATRRWKNLKNKSELLARLLDEQYNLCCYSEIHAALLDLGSHIEHVENKSQNPQRTFDYTNLAASALSSSDIASTGDFQQPVVFGGHARNKQKSVDIQRFIQPFQADCARFFHYLSDGRVIPATGLSQAEIERVDYTINYLLNLNSPFLITERRKWWDELAELFDQHLQNEMDLHCLAGIDLVPRNQTLSPFFSLTRQFFGRIAEDVLQQDAPELV